MESERGLEFEGSVLLEGPQGARGTLSGLGSSLTLQVEDLKAARHLLGSQALQSQLLNLASSLPLLEKMGVNFQFRVGERTVFASTKAAGAARLMARFMRKL